jgi:hypothetical protein
VRTSAIAQQYAHFGALGAMSSAGPWRARFRRNIAAIHDLALDEGIVTWLNTGGAKADFIYLGVEPGQGCAGAGRRGSGTVRLLTAQRCAKIGRGNVRRMCSPARSAWSIGKLRPVCRIVRAIADTSFLAQGGLT